MRYLIILSAMAAFLGGCTNDDPELQPGKMPLVVEGWIEEGESPIVMVTHAVDLTSATPSFDDFVEKWGRVTIYDNDRPYILTGRLNHDYTPSLVFTSTRLKGKTGHTYRLTIETEDDFAEAEAIINNAPQFISAEPVKEAEGYSIAVRITDTTGAIQFQTRTLGVDGRFYPAFYSTYSEVTDPDNTFKITKGSHAAYDDDNAESFSNFFASGETVMIKVCRIPDELYPFWTAYDQAVSLGGNLFLNMPQNCPGNINGGLGYFSASGISIIAVSIP